VLLCCVWRLRPFGVLSNPSFCKCRTQFLFVLLDIRLLTEVRSQFAIAAEELSETSVHITAEGAAGALSETSVRVHITAEGAEFSKRLTETVVLDSQWRSLKEHAVAQQFKVPHTGQQHHTRHKRHQYSCKCGCMHVCVYVCVCGLL
jgi:hypothetical protein